MSSITRKLTQKQRRFVDEYIISGNATQAYRKAGYSAKSDGTAWTEASKLLRNPKVQAELKRRNDEIKSAKTMDMQEVMERLASFGRGEVTEEQVTTSGEIVQVKTKNSDQIRALELIGKRYGAWTDKKEVSGSLEIDVGVGEYDEDD